MVEGCSDAFNKRERKKVLEVVDLTTCSDEELVEFDSLEIQEVPCGTGSNGISFNKQINKTDVRNMQPSECSRSDLILTKKGNESTVEVFFNNKKSHYPLTKLNKTPLEKTVVDLTSNINEPLTVDVNCDSVTKKKGKKLPIIVHVLDNNDLLSSTKTLSPKCPICLEDISNRACYSTVCGHIYCEACISGLVGDTKICAICRKPITRKNAVHRIYMS